MRLGRHQQAFCLECVEQLLARVVAVEPLVFGGTEVVHFRVERQHADRHQPVALPHLPVVEVVRRGDLDHAGAEFAVDVLIRDDGDAALGDGQAHLLADEMPVAFVLGVHGNRAVAEQGFRARGGDRQIFGAVLVPFRVFERIADFPDEAVFLGAHHFEVGHRGLQHGVPVHQPLAAIDEPFAVEPHEHLGDGLRQAGIHSEALAAPVGAGAEPAHLTGDGRARVLLPLPHLVEEFLAAEIVARDALRVELAFHNDLRGDAGVVGAGLPQRVVARHAVIAGERVHQGVLESVAHVQRAGDVGRRQHDAVGGRVGRVAGLEVAGAFPLGVPAFFNVGRFEGFGEFHGVRAKR